MTERLTDAAKSSYFASGQKVTVGQQVKNKREAQWLVAQMRTAIGL